MCETTRKTLTIEAINAVHEAEYEATRPAIDAAYEAAGGGDDIFHRLLRDPVAMCEAACALQDRIHSLAGEDPDRLAIAVDVIRALEERDLINIHTAWLGGRKAGALLMTEVLMGADYPGAANLSAWVRDRLPEDHDEDAARDAEYLAIEARHYHQITAAADALRAMLPATDDAARAIGALMDAVTIMGCDLAAAGYAHGRTRGAVEGLAGLTETTDQ